MMNHVRIKIFCRSFDLKLYRLSKGLYESWGFPCVRLTDQSADGYFYTMLKHTDCDIAINIDEDCFITNKQAVLDLVNYVIDQKIANAGCPDGGTWCPRGGNPLITNPFFNVFNLNLIREKFSKQAIQDYDYGQYRSQLESAFPQEFLYKDRPYNFDNSRYLEPYYPFFLWMAGNMKTLYLHNERYSDGWTTILHNHKGEEMCRHTWLARFYSMPSFIVKHWQPTAGAQQRRIDVVIDYAYQIQNIEKPNFGFFDKLSFTGNKIIRWCIKVPQRIMGWPKKLKRKLSRNS